MAEMVSHLRDIRRMKLEKRASRTAHGADTYLGSSPLTAAASLHDDQDASSTAAPSAHAGRDGPEGAAGLDTPLQAGAENPSAAARPASPRSVPLPASRSPSPEIREEPRAGAPAGAESGPPTRPAAPPAPSRPPARGGIAETLQAILSFLQNLDEDEGAEERGPAVDAAGNKKPKKSFKEKWFGLNREQAQRGNGAYSVNLPAMPDVSAPDMLNYLYKYKEDDYGKELDDEARVWWMYNDEAKLFDDDLAAELGDGLDLCLVFVSSSRTRCVDWSLMTNRPVFSLRF